MLAGNLDKSVLEELIKNKVVTDIVVVALLRVQGNSHHINAPINNQIHHINTPTNTP